MNQFHPVMQIEPAKFQETIDHINELFDGAENLSCRVICEGCLACLTGYAIHYCFKTHYEQVSDGAEKPRRSGL